MKDKIRVEFEWREFYKRFVLNKEEFTFEYEDKTIYLSFGYDKDRKLVCGLAYGNLQKGFLTKDYASPQEFLKDKIFDGKTLEEVWDAFEFYDLKK